VTHDDLTKLGYRQQPDGSWSRPAAGAQRLPHAVAQQNARPALEHAPQIQGPSADRITVCITRCGSRLLDVDNMAGGCKPLVDQLRYAKLIPDDDPASVEIVFRQEKAAKGAEMTIVEISQPSI
jgi:hypothetical protein